MMVQKVKLFGDEATARKMFQIQSPAAHRMLGRQVRGFSDEVWKESRYFPSFALMIVGVSFVFNEFAPFLVICWPSSHLHAQNPLIKAAQDRFRIVVDGTRQKFSPRNADLRAQLLQTKDRELVEVRQVPPPSRTYRHERWNFNNSPAATGVAHGQNLGHRLRREHCGCQSSQVGEEPSRESIDAGARGAAGGR